MITLFTFIGTLVAACFGAIFGSYATLFAYRLPRGESCFGRYFGQKSRCPKCSAIIKTRDLIPLLNWFITLGRCRSCQTKIPRVHLFIELATTLAFVLCYLSFSFSEEFMIYALISVAAIILIATEFTHKIFPFEILNFMLIVGIAGRVLHDGNVVDIVISAAMGAIFATIFYQIFYKKNGEIFANQQQALDCAKFILVASVCLPSMSFVFYFLTLTLILSAVLLFDLHRKKLNFTLGSVLIVPFLGLILLPPSIL